MPINMKKLILFLGILILSQCQIGPKEAQAQKFSRNVVGLNSLESWTETADNGIVYRIFSYGDGAHSASIQVINVTKEKLEIEKLKLEIKKLQSSK